MENIKLVVLDIDGTILSENKEEISNNVVEAINKLHKKNIKTIIATGRHYKFISKQIINSLNPDYIISINGGCLSDKDGNVIKTHTMNEKCVLDLINICRKNDIALGFKCENNIKIRSKYKEYVDNYVGKNSPYINLLINEENIDTPIYPLGSFLIGDENIIESFKEKFNDLVFAKSYKDAYDAFMKDVNKSTSIEDALKFLNLTWDNVLACGDAGNDTEMIRKAKIGVCMGNAKEESVKLVADYITDSVENDGVVKALQFFKII